MVLKNLRCTWSGSGTRRVVRVVKIRCALYVLVLRSKFFYWFPGIREPPLATRLSSPSPISLIFWVTTFQWVLQPLADSSQKVKFGESSPLQGAVLYSRLCDSCSCGMGVQPWSPCRLKTPQKLAILFRNFSEISGFPRESTS